ncbi:hypothetical protein [Hoylesella timonensis]|uniref:hypothetical protein n=1 Tax=Hoylesella timonensis TaxID=386414 RepID=UPI00242E8698|nr:hypothetical protein [Hoylesella timonensis]
MTTNDLLDITAVNVITALSFKGIVVEQQMKPIKQINETRRCTQLGILAQLIATCPAICFDRLQKVTVRKTVTTAVLTT